MSRTHLLKILPATGLLLVCLTLAACGGRPEPSPTPTRTPRPPTYTPTPVPVVVVEDTPTPAPPTATPTPLVAATPTETPTEMPTSTATVNPSLIIPAPGSGISPFTGLRPADPAVLDRRPLAIKVSEEKSVIPQSGLSKADVVVESRVEFEMTRFTTIFHSQDAARVGPIRSARLIDLDVPVIFDAVLAFSGGVQPVRQKLYDSDLGDHVLEQALNGPSFFRDTTISPPHNLFADTSRMWRTVTARGWNSAPAPSGAFVFSEAPPAGGGAANAVRVAYPQFPPTWTYDAASGRYFRALPGGPHIDVVTGEQLSAANVVNIVAPHVVTLIVEHGSERQGEGQSCRNCSIEIQVWGEGPLRIFRDGRVYEGKWVRPERHAPFRFLDASGADIPLKPGNSWWQVTPPNTEVTW